MISNREFVSRIVTGGKMLSKDNRISWRYVLSVGKTKASRLMAQKMDELSLTREEGIKTPIDCFRMERVRGKDCGIAEFKTCDKLMVSCKELPDILFGKTGSGVVSVINMDGTKDYKFTTPNQWRRDKQRSEEYKIGNTGKFYISDKRLYLPDSTNELVDLVVITPDKVGAKQVSGCGGTTNLACGEAWDTDFICPDRFLDLVIQDTISEVANYYRTSVPDENPNMDTHQKTKTTP